MMYENFDYSPDELVSPIWITDDLCVCLGGVSPPSNTAAVFKIKSTTTFGTGGHPATRAVMLALHDKVFEGARVLDWRAGTGLLGIYTFVFGASEVVSFNPKESELTEAIQNAIANNCIIHPCRSTGLNDYDGFFDLIISHQFLPQKARMDAEVMADVTKQGATVLLSGWRPERHRYVRSVIEEFFTIKAIGDIDSFPIIEAEK